MDERQVEDGSAQTVDPSVARPIDEPKNLTDLQVKASQIISRLHDAVNNPSAPNQNDNEPSDALPERMAYADSVIERLQALVIQTDDDELDGVLPFLTAQPELAIVAHSLAAYLSLLDRGQLQRLNARLNGETGRWLGHLFGFPDCFTYFHDDQFEGLLRLTRMSLHYRYPRYADEGWCALAPAPPVLYCNALSPPGPLQYVCRQLGLPLACIRPVPPPDPNKHDYDAQSLTIERDVLKRMMDEDMQMGRTPLLVLGEVGTVFTGHVDDVAALAELCREYNVWLHLHGHGLAALVCASHNGGSNIVAALANSYTLNVGVWLDIPGLPVTTLYRLIDTPRPQSLTESSQTLNQPQHARNQSQVSVSRESTLPIIAGLGLNTRRITCLPMWCALQMLGQRGVQVGVLDKLVAVDNVWKVINTFPRLRIISPPPGNFYQFESINDPAMKPTNAMTLVNAAITCVVFQFQPHQHERHARVPPYYDKLNSWLGQVMQRDMPQIAVQMCELDAIGLVLRYCPFDGGDTFQDPIESLDHFRLFLEQQIEIMIATVEHKVVFNQIVEASGVLQMVQVPEWAGLGGVRYVPTAWQGLASDHVRQEINRLNINLVDALRATDSAFSLGEASDGLACVRFGLVTEDTDLDALLGLVVSVGRKVEESSKVMDSMTEIVKKGIETATLDLQRENEERLRQEGILRQVPIVGTFYNWWSPKPSETGVRGRSLNLTQGVVESTENIYKYHMQRRDDGVTDASQTSAATLEPEIRTKITHTDANENEGGVTGDVQIDA